MKKPKNIPTHYKSKGTPIFRDTTALPFDKGGPINPAGPVNTFEPALSESEMKAKIAYEAALGNTAAQRMLSLNPKTYDFGDGNFGTHYMASFGNYAVPTLQDTGKASLEYIENPPPGKEDFKFSTPEQAEYFAENYKTVSPMITQKYLDGGPLVNKTNHGDLLPSVYASALGNYYAKGGMLKRADGSYSPRGLWDNIRDNAGSGKKPTKQMLAQEKKINREYRAGGQFPRPYSLPEDSFRQGGDNLHNSVYASSPAQYPALYKYGGSFQLPRQQMYMPLDHVERYGGPQQNMYKKGGSVFYATNTPQLEGEGKNLMYNLGGTLSFEEGGAFPGSKDQWGRSLNDKWYGFDPQTKKYTIAPYKIQELRNQAAGVSKYDPLEQRALPSETTQQTAKNLPSQKKSVNEAMAIKTAEKDATIQAVKELPLLTQEQKNEVLMDPRKLDEYIYLTRLAQQPDTVKESIPYSARERVWDIITNPFDAFEYSVRTGDVSNMPRNYNQMRMAGIDPSAGRGANAVGNTLNTFTNLFDAGDKVVRNVGEGNYGTAALEAMRFIPGARVNTGAGKYLTTQTPLKNAYRLNPSARTTFANIGEQPHWLKGYGSNTPKQLPGSGNVAPAVNTTPAPWTMQEMPGLHIKSTMMSNPKGLHTQVSKEGTINTENALKFIKNNEGEEKYNLIRQAFGENIPKKMNYNEFRKVVQDQLIPLERQFSTNKSHYGIGKLGYSPHSTKSNFETVIAQADNGIANVNKQIEITSSPIKKHYGEGLNGEHVYSFENPYGVQYYPTEAGAIAGQEKSLADLNGMLNNAIAKRASYLSKVQEFPLENQTLILGNKNKFGRGSSAHGNPDETLGHIHFLRDGETPDVLTATQFQADPFQSKYYWKYDVNEQTREIGNAILNKKWDKDALMLKTTSGDTKKAIEAIEAEIKTLKNELEPIVKANTPNYKQKILLEAAHEERMLQELVNYAGERGDVTKVRVPTSKTAAKIQNYKPVTTGEIKGDIYDAAEATILKKYSDYGSSIGKDGKKKKGIIENLFGVEPRVVTDNKGNTWYEFDIPESFKGMKGEIKAFSMGGQL
jgi:hypothetical protein